LVTVAGDPAVLGALNLGHFGDPFGGGVLLVVADADRSKVCRLLGEFRPGTVEFLVPVDIRFRPRASLRRQGKRRRQKKEPSQSHGSLYSGFRRTRQSRRDPYTLAAGDFSGPVELPIEQFSGMS
jgi:hypothetical protein